MLCDRPAAFHNGGREVQDEQTDDLPGIDLGDDGGEFETLCAGCCSAGSGHKRTRSEPDQDRCRQGIHRAGVEESSAVYGELTKISSASSSKDDGKSWLTEYDLIYIRKNSP